MAKASPALQTIAERYRLIARVGKGGMGEVYRARDLVLGRTVALKILPPDLVGRPDVAERFRAEAQAAARLSHPNVVQIHDCADADGTTFIVMEYVRGRSLRHVLSTRGPLAPRQAAEVALQLLAALGAAHERGLVHRDVKPENLLVTVDGTVKVADFGIARVAEAVTEQGAVLGTVAYAAPEQIRGEEVDGRADLYAAGCVLYEMGTGVPPYEGEVAQVLHQHLYGRVPAPSRERPELEPLDPVVLKATDPDLDERYDTARQMRDDLEGAVRVLGDAPPLSELTEELTSEVPGPSAETAVVELRRPRGRRRRWPALLVLLALLTGALLVLRPTRVPATAGQDLAAARRRLEAAGLEPRVQRVFSDSHPPDVAVGTRPGAGGFTRQRASVLLRVSKGPDVVAVPPLSGRSLDDATGLLRSQGFVVGAVERRYDAADEGMVIDQNPRAGQVERRGSVVNLGVSSGPELLGVPDVRGKTADEASKLLADSGFGTTRKEAFADAQAGTVFEQAPLPGERLERGQPVEIVVSKGPEPFAMPEVTGQNCGEAKARLEGLGLGVDVQSRSGTCGTPRVLAQDPLPGARVQKGGQATLYAG